jgi:hypothetical protein
MTDILRYCGHCRWLFLYWIETIYDGILSDIQKDMIIRTKRQFAKWIITTSGYYDKSIKGNWKEEIDADNVLNSPIFSRFLQLYYDIMIRRTNPVISCEGLPTGKRVFINNFDIEHNMFLRVVYPDSITNAVSLREQFGANSINSNTAFQICAGKNVLIINLFADLICKHYRSGKIIEWYQKLSANIPNGCVIPSIANISAIETPYPFGNGLNETMHNNFFETLDAIKSLIDDHKESYDIAIISCGIYTPFIADYIGKRYNKLFICYGRYLQYMFLIHYKHTYTWMQCAFSKNNIGPYLCDIPDTYKLQGYDRVEEGCYW